MNSLVESRPRRIAYNGPCFSCEWGAGAETRQRLSGQLRATERDPDEWRESRNRERVRIGSFKPDSAD